MTNNKVSVAGSVRSFIPQTRAIPSMPEAQATETPIDKVSVAKEALQRLSAEEKSQLLSAMFEQEIATIKKEAAKQAFDASFDSSKEAHDSKFLERLERLEHDIDTVASFTKTINNAEKWQLADEELIKSLIISAVAKLTANLACDEHVQLAFFEALVTKHIEEQAKTLYLPESLYLIVEKAEKFTALNALISVKPDPDLAIGDYRIEFSKSGIEYSLKQALVSLAMTVADAEIDSSLKGQTA